MDGKLENRLETKKRSRQIDREMNTALYVLRAVQSGVSICDLKSISYGLVLDMIIEANNDNYEYDYIATQADIDNL